ncbi:helix-turn-helix transcriptional regulator [Slackia isoflavoniconvertens]|uniref:helix-turn-helix transcriptional regulator n=1 Tax=Slackia isoflavoniconvertens TaxID=572010 RepID=UPI003D0377D9
MRDAVASESVSSRVGNIARQAREQAGISQAGFAEECGMRQPTLSRIERGATNPTVETLNDIAKALGKKLEVRFV